VAVVNMKEVMSRLHRLAAASVLSAGLFAVPALAIPVPLPAAVAHDGLVKATPGQGATVDTAPKSLVLEFSAQPRGTYDTIALSKDKDVIFSGTPTIDANVLTLELPADVTLDDGEYVVGYQITSSDGHATRGSYNFTLAGNSSSQSEGSSPATSASTANANSDQDSKDSGLPSWTRPALAVAGVIVLLGVLVTLIARLRRSDD